jgi:hypothetical protein
MWRWRGRLIGSGARSPICSTSFNIWKRAAWTCIWTNNQSTPRRTNDGHRRFVYDAANQLTEIHDQGANLRIKYDGDGGQVMVTEGGITSVLFGDMYECDQQTCVNHIFAGQRRIASVSNKSKRIVYFHHDHLVRKRSFDY